MALKEKARNVREHGARTVDIDTNGNNYLGTTSTGTKGVTVSVNITSGTATDFDLGYAVNNTATMPAQRSLPMKAEKSPRQAAIFRCSVAATRIFI